MGRDISADQSRSGRVEGHRCKKAGGTCRFRLPRSTTDAPDPPVSILCYTANEILAEKTRALYRDREGPGTYTTSCGAPEIQATVLCGRKDEIQILQRIVEAGVPQSITQNPRSA